MNDLIRISDDGKVTARELYEFLQLDSTHFIRWFKNNIIDNQFAAEGTDYKVFAINGENPKGGRPGQDADLSIDFAKKLCMVSKSERGEQARNYFIEVEKRFKKVENGLSDLSPQLQLLINLELKQKEQERQIAEVNQRVDNIREVVALSPNDWRRDCQSLIKRMAQAIGGYEHIRTLTSESYKLLNERMGVDLQCRLTNKRRRMADEGVCKSKRDKLNPLDVIADDKKLIEGYVAIIKEMAIKYGAEKTA